MTQKLDLYGIGNAIVDTEIPIEDVFFAELNLTKGSMCLIDEAHLNKQLDRFKADNMTLAAGGSCANTMYAAAQLGIKTGFSGSVSSDDAGRFYMDDLRSVGIDCHFQPQQNKALSTGRCLAYIHPDGQRTFETFLGIASDFSVKDLHLESIATAEIVYCEGFLFSTDQGFEACMEAKKQRSKKIALTLSDIFMVETFKNRFIDFLRPGNVDYLFCNESELCAYTKQSDLQAAANILLNCCKVLVVTQADQGATVFTSQRSYVCKPPTYIKPLNTNGAGDAFAGGFLSAVLKGANYEDAAHQANAIAAKVIQVSGPRYHHKV